MLLAFRGSLKVVAGREGGGGGQLDWYQEIVELGKKKESFRPHTQKVQSHCATVCATAAMRKKKRV